MKSNQGQNVVEYVLLVVAVLVVCMVFLARNGGPFRSQVETSLNSMVNQIDKINNNITLNP